MINATTRLIIRSKSHWQLLWWLKWTSKNPFCWLGLPWKCQWYMTHDLIFEMPLPLCYKQGPQIGWWRPIPIFQVMPPPPLFFRQQALRPNAYLASQQTEENPITTSDLSFAPIEPQQLQSCTDTSHLSCWVEVHQTGSPLSSLWLR